MGSRYVEVQLRLKGGSTERGAHVGIMKPCNGLVLEGGTRISRKSGSSVEVEVDRRDPALWGHVLGEVRLVR